MYAHERSLVKRLEGKPFALIGVNSDSDREAIKKVVRKEGITWRSFWNGGSHQGPIATAWNVTSWPTIFVLDAKGVIRAADVQEKQLDEAVDKLLQELPPDTAREK
jgi:hypothetical protein